MRAKVDPNSKHPVDNVPPGKEGDFIDNRATRSLIAAGLLHPLEELPPEPPPKPAKAPHVSAPDDLRRMHEDFDRSWKAREAEHRAERERAGARLAETEAARAKLEAENVVLRAELDAIRAAAAPKGKGKKGEEPATEKPEG